MDQNRVRDVCSTVLNLCREGKRAVLAHCVVVGKRHDASVISGVDGTLQGPEMCLCSQFGCSIPDRVGGVCRQRSDALTRPPLDPFHHALSSNRLLIS